MGTYKADDEDTDLPSSFIINFDDARGWNNAYIAGKYTWRWGLRPRLYYPASLQYKPGQEYFAVDGMGRRRKGTQPFECTINPVSGKFERLCVQTRDSFCQLQNSTWDRTIMRNSAPGMLRLSQFPFRGILLSKRHDPNKWDNNDRLSVALRWLPATLGITILVRIPSALSQVMTSLS
jgi:hypothetical protein